MRSSVAVVAKRLTHSKQEGMAGAPQKGRVVRVKLRDLEAVLPADQLQPGRGRSGALTGALQQLVWSIKTLYGVPAPSLRLLENDRSAQGISSNPEYLHWLLMRRAAELDRNAGTDAVSQRRE